MRGVPTSVSNVQVVFIINTSHLSARLYLHDLDAWSRLNFQNCLFVETIHHNAVVATEGIFGSSMYISF